MGYYGGVPVEDMQSLTIASLSAADVAKQYEHIRELGKGTYGKVDLVAHQTQGELIRWSRQLKMDIHFYRADHDNKTVLLHRSDQPCKNGSARPRILPEIECGVKMK